MLRTAAVASVAVVVTVTATATGAPGGSTTQGREPGIGPGGAHWVDTWVSMPQLTEPHNMPPAPYTDGESVLADSTLRQTIRTTVAGEKLRLRFSNAFGGAELPLTRVSVALPAGGAAGVAAIEPGSARQVTFGGRTSTVVPMGAQVVSDPLRMKVPAGTNLTVTVYLAEGQASSSVTSHPGSRTSSYLAKGDHATAADLPDATRTDHWYFLSGAETWSEDPRSAGLVVIGDSLSDGRGSTTNGNDRWTDQLHQRLLRSPSTAHVAVLNQAAGGNRVLHDGLGPNVLARLDRDVLVRSGARWALVFEGVNDLGTAEATASAQEATADDLIAAYRQIVDRSHAAGIAVYGATLTPFGGNDMYDDPDGHREAARKRVNDWIRHSGVFDAVVDFDRAVRDPKAPTTLLPAYDTGDHLHLNPVGYGALADAVPARLLR
ncbi:GDSL-type esterase/lipase family protein [Streptomyces abyssomicinicus]|uniref:GDSL-type esterase/lipase family protein n=1 Tax=Streptomyces abyssomicinicus TaxID=574929 RepID=UPI0012501B45|nr:GDSL-type esterase/lipase family protein [Streptomyces abyssomicinicus]